MDFSDAQRRGVDDEALAAVDFDAVEAEVLQGFPLEALADFIEIAAVESKCTQVDARKAEILGGLLGFGDSAQKIKTVS